MLRMRPPPRSRPKGRLPTVVFMPREVNSPGDEGRKRRPRGGDAAGDEESGGGKEGGGDGAPSVATQRKPRRPEKDMVAEEVEKQPGLGAFEWGLDETEDMFEEEEESVGQSRGFSKWFGRSPKSGDGPGTSGEAGFCVDAGSSEECDFMTEETELQPLSDATASAPLDAGEGVATDRADVEGGNDVPETEEAVPALPSVEVAYKCGEGASEQSSETPG
mmetsp:Transcript_126210/g.281538  ORF Transcript_126210/g.281538 Transcript_126210/m.281538 type:complete len:219 (+) Transcript_126210:153-809(+)